jgi:protein-disulfide isomerase
MLTKPVTPEDHIQGPESAPVTLVEYGDFECPHCGRAFPVIEEVRKRMGSRLRFVFRHFPLTEVHTSAEAAAEAAEAAGEQGKFWEMHHMIFRHQDQLEVADLVRYAEDLGLDVALFKKSLTGRKFKEHVHQDFMSGVRSGVNGTPTFFINGARYNGYAKIDDLIQALEKAMQA